MSSFWVESIAPTVLAIGVAYLFAGPKRIEELKREWQDQFYEWFPNIRRFQYERSQKEIYKSIQKTNQTIETKVEIRNRISAYKENPARTSVLILGDLAWVIALNFASLPLGFTSVSNLMSNLESNRLNGSIVFIISLALLETSLVFSASAITIHRQFVNADKLTRQYQKQINKLEKRIWQLKIKLLEFGQDNSIDQLGPLPSLEILSSLSVEERHKLLAPYVTTSYKESIERDIEPISLKEIAALPLDERYRRLAPYIAATAHDFLTDPTLTEFSILDGEDWEEDEQSDSK